MSMTPEVWDFPRFHGVKAIGLSTSEVQATLISLVEDAKLTYKKTSIRSKASSNGKYISITAEVQFNTAEEVKLLYKNLHSHPDIVQSL